MGIDAGAPATSSRPPARTAPATGRPRARELAVHLVVLAACLAVGMVEMLPHGAELRGQLTPFSNCNEYVWDFWWVARQVVHLHNPWTTTYMAAPAGIPLGYDTLMPLPGVLLMPVTLIFGAAAAFTVATLALPGLICYAMYRLARLWLPSQVGAIAAGGFFGLATVGMFQDEYHVNIAAGQLLLPLALEASVRLRRSGRYRYAVILGLILGASVLVNQESAVMALILVACALLPWLARSPRAEKFRATALAGLVTALVASPQIVAMATQVSSATAVSPNIVAYGDSKYGVPLTTMFTPSPRLASLGLTGLGHVYHWAWIHEARPTYGVTLTVLAIAGLAAAWRRRSAGQLALLWIAASALALGTSLIIGHHRYLPLAAHWHGVTVSDLMPFTWLVRIPGMSIFREADRLELLGLLPAALLAGAAVDWLSAHARPLVIAALACGLLESGWASTTGYSPVLPALDGPIAADHSHSIVVDVPFGLNGGIPSQGGIFNPEALVLATQDGHPRAISYTSWVPPASWNSLMRHPFYRDLQALQEGHRRLPAALASAGADARRMDVGWVLFWPPKPGVTSYVPPRALASYLRHTGFRFGYRADGVSVYRVIPGPGPAARSPVSRQAAVQKDKTPGCPC